MFLAILSALAEFTRLAVIRMLRDQSKQCVCDLMSKLNATQNGCGIASIPT